MTLSQCSVPQDALLQRYVGQGATYTDCFSAHTVKDVDLHRFVTGFYTSAVFRAERFVLSGVLRKRIYDSDIAPFLAGEADQFAVWQIEAQTADQLLVRDVSGATRSWFQARALAAGGSQLLFGSAVVAANETRLPWLVSLTTPLHRQYSKLLLRAALRII